MLRYSSAKVNTISADALAPFVTRSSPTMILTMYDEHILVLHKEGFQPPDHLNVEE